MPPYKRRASPLELSSIAVNKQWWFLPQRYKVRQAKESRGNDFPTNKPGAPRGKIYKVCAQEISSRLQNWTQETLTSSPRYNHVGTSSAYLWLPTRGCKSRWAVLSAFSSYLSRTQGCCPWREGGTGPALGSTSAATPRLCYLPASATFSCFSYISNPPNTCGSIGIKNSNPEKRNCCAAGEWICSDLFIPTHPSHPRSCSGGAWLRETQQPCGYLFPWSTSRIPHWSHLSFHTSCHMKTPSTTSLLPSTPPPFTSYSIPWLTQLSSHKPKQQN